MQLSADVPLELVPTDAELRRLLARTDVAAAVGARGVPCRVWGGGAQVRYHGQRWSVQRLFYAIGVTGGHRNMTKALVSSVCGRANCVESRHLQAAPRLPPTHNGNTHWKKRKIDDSDNRGKPVALSMAVRRRRLNDIVHSLDGDDTETPVEDEVDTIMRELHEELAAIDADERADGIVDGGAIRLPPDAVACLDPDAVVAATVVASAVR